MKLKDLRKIALEKQRKKRELRKLNAGRNSRNGGNGKGIVASTIIVHENDNENDHKACIQLI